MGSSYLKNHLGLALTDTQYEDIPYPTAELITHVTIKMVQAGTLLGGLVIAPITSLIQRQWSFQAMVPRITRYGRNGLLIGLVLGPLATYSKVRNDPVEKIIDRDFRLRHNKNQVRVDQGSILGGLTGSGFNAMMRLSPVTGGVIGIPLGVIGMAVYNHKSSR